MSDASACTTAAPSAPAASASTTIESVFDGWGYVRLFQTKIPGDIGVPGSIKQIDTYTVPEAQNAAHATGSGTLSVHEVVMDPNPGRMLAYLSYYDAGLRVVRFSATTARCGAASSSP